MNRPDGIVTPPTQELQAAQDMINNGQSEQALSRLGNQSGGEFLEHRWRDYLSGTAYFTAKDLEKGFGLLNGCYEKIKSRPESTSEELRLAGLCLKKMGWYYRKAKDYTKAFTYHSYRLHYALDTGSPLEVHDALISLDVDAYFMKEGALSERILKQSIRFGEQVADKKLRVMALGTSFNNLGGTLYGNKKFAEAESAILQSLKHWQSYEDLAGTKENRVVWAYFGIGDVYENWAKHLKELGQDYATQKTNAIDAYQKGKELGQQRGLKDDDLSYFAKQLKSVGEL